MRDQAFSHPRRLRLPSLPNIFRKSVVTAPSLKAKGESTETPSASVPDPPADASPDPAPADPTPVAPTPVATAPCSRCSALDRTCAECLVKATLRGEAERADQALRDAMTEAAERSRYSLFQTRRGLLHLEELSDEEALRLAARGLLTPDEVKTWERWRWRRLEAPRETRHELFLLKARRAGYRHGIISRDGRATLLP